MRLCEALSQGKKKKWPTPAAECLCEKPVRKEEAQPCQGPSPGRGHSRHATMLAKMQNAALLPHWGGETERSFSRWSVSVVSPWWSVLGAVVPQADFGDNHSEAPPPLLATHLHEGLGDGCGGGKGKTLHVEPGGARQTGVCPEQAENKELGARTFVHTYSHLISPPTLSMSCFYMRGRE